MWKLGWTLHENCRSQIFNDIMRKFIFDFSGQTSLPIVYKVILLILNILRTNFPVNKLNSFRWFEVSLWSLNCFHDFFKHRRKFSLILWILQFFFFCCQLSEIHFHWNNLIWHEKILKCVKKHSDDKKQIPWNTF